MPQTVNGIGDWYYGRRRPHRHRGVCDLCGAVTDLESYDTTRYVVALYVPVLPLSKLRIVESCPACQRYRAVPLKQWEKRKAEAMDEAIETLRGAPDDSAAALAVVGVATGFQDEELFDRLREALIDVRTADASVRAGLGGAFTYFSRHEEAAEAYRGSLALQDDPRVREQLGLSYLRLGRPAEAAPWFTHVLSTPEPERTWMLYQLAAAYQEEGDHAAALDVIEQTLARFPDLEADGDWRALKRSAAKYAGTTKPVGRSALRDRGGPKREPGRLADLTPKLGLLVVPALILLFFAWHTYSAVTRAGAHPVFLVNGSANSYTVNVNGQPIPLAAGQNLPLTVPEGTVTIEPGPGAVGVDAAEFVIQTSFWSRPYSRPVVVLNPDRLAIVVREVAIYAEPRQDSPPDQYFTGEVAHVFHNVNHAFEAFPQQLHMKKGETATRVRVGLADAVSLNSRAGYVAELADAKVKADYPRRWLLTAPDDPLAVQWFAGTAPRDEALKVLKPRLADRPVRVEWHRAYQNLASNAVDASDLKPEYADLVGSTDRHPDALYLLARVSDYNESVTLLQEAVASGKPAHYAHFSLGFHRLCQGEFDAACDEFALAEDLVKREPYSASLRDALLAAGRLDDLQKVLDADLAAARDPGSRARVHRARVHLAAVRKDAAGTLQARQAVLTGFGVARPYDRVPETALFDQTEAAATGDRAKYLLAAARSPDPRPARVAVLNGDVSAARAAVAAPGRSDDDALDLALAYLSVPARDKQLAREVKAELAAKLSAGGGEDRAIGDVLSGKEPLRPEAARQLTIDPRRKRVFLAVFARAFPDDAAEFRPLAKALDFHRDDVSLCLAKVAGK